MGKDRQSSLPKWSFGQKSVQSTDDACEKKKAERRKRRCIKGGEREIEESEEAGEGAEVEGKGPEEY